MEGTVATSHGQTPDPERERLAKSIFQPSPLEEVARAVAVASETERLVYVERSSAGYRWSLAHRGGAYPLMRIAARFLRMDHSRLIVGFRTLDNGVAILTDPKEAAAVDAWAVLEFDGLATVDEVSSRIQEALPG